MELPPLTLVIPVYNELKAIDATIERCERLLENLPAGSNVLLVDDGSTDGTRERLASLKDSPAIQAIFQPRNRGYGAALKRGILAARHPVIAICDADGTYPMEKIPGFLESMISNDAAMVVGARKAGETPLVRRPAKAFLRWLAQHLTGERIPDMNSGLRLFYRDDARRLFNLLPDGFSFTTTITMALLTEGREVLFRPIRYRVRVGSSKIRPIRDTANFLMLICRTALAFNPMRVFGPAGFFLTAVGCVLLLLRLVLDKPFGVATTIAFLVGGVQLLALGLLADLVNRRGNQPPSGNNAT
ncbi:MAG: glycosyltransferase family 2 protein [Candidatus Sumerlaeia bacterium]|nr:glycosyltransferase family 2 protein [Candidatus Sumerlaeia bacterium]